MTAEITSKSHVSLQLVTLDGKNAPQHSLLEMPQNALKHCPLAKELGDRFFYVPQDGKPTEPVPNCWNVHLGTLL